MESEDVQTSSDEIINENVGEVQENESNHYGYWVFSGDMKNLNLTDLSEHGVTDILLITTLIKDSIKLI